LPFPLLRKNPLAASSFCIFHTHYSKWGGGSFLKWLPIKQKLSYCLFPAKNVDYVVIGIPEEQFRELNAKFPPQSPFAGQNPKVNEAIKDGISDEEADHIRRHLNLQRSTKLKFTFEGIAQHLVDEAKRKPSFVLNGKSFWVFRLSWLKESPLG
jgi:hypothetical protein